MSMTDAIVLVVDDEMNILSAVRRALRTEEYAVQVTSDPHEALAFASRQTVAAVVSDQRMPVMEGTELLSRMRTVSPDTVRIMLTGYADIEAARRAINHSGIFRFLSKPWDDDDLRQTLRQAIEHHQLVCENKRLSELTERQNRTLKDFNATLKKKVMQRTGEVVTLNRTLRESFLGSVRAMARLGEMHSPLVGSHAKRVAQVSREIGVRMGLSGSELDKLEIAATLHDIGKTQIDPSILKKPTDRLDAGERSILRQHPIQGEAIVRLVPDLEEAAMFVRHHHERFDGHGYPDGLHGRDIPLASRIIAAVNAYDNALNVRHLFGDTTPIQAARAVQSKAPTEFDRDVVDHLLVYVKETEGRADRTSEAEVNMRDLQAGMMLSRDLVTSRGVLLLSRNNLITLKHLERLQNHHTSDPILSGIHVYRRTPETSANRPALMSGG
jgi:response regulator RpfG family c-di-GMP phosphodiesterase